MELKVIRLANGCIFPWYENISDVYVLILPTISKRKRIPRFFWEWSRMRKQSKPGRLSPPTRPGYEAKTCFHKQALLTTHSYWHDSTLLNSFLCVFLSFFLIQLGRLIDSYVIVNKFADLHPQPAIPKPVMSSLLAILHDNPHAFRISMKHTLAVACKAKTSSTNLAPCPIQSSPTLTQSHASITRWCLLLCQCCSEWWPSFDGISERHSRERWWKITAVLEIRAPIFLQLATQNVPWRHSLCWLMFMQQPHL